MITYRFLFLIHLIWSSFDMFRESKVSTEFPERPTVSHTQSVARKWETWTWTCWHITWRWLPAWRVARLRSGTDEKTLMDFCRSLLTRKFWCEVVFVARLKSLFHKGTDTVYKRSTTRTLLARLEMGNLPWPFAGADRSDARPTVGRLEPFKGLLDPSEKQQVYKSRISKETLHLRRKNLKKLLQLCAGIGRKCRAGPNALWTCSSFPENDEWNGS